MGGFALSGLFGSGRASMLPLGTLSLGLWVIAVDPAFIAGHQCFKNCRIWIDQLDHLPAVMTTSFFLIFSEHLWDKLCANLLHLQFLANNCVYSRGLRDIYYQGLSHDWNSLADVTISRYLFYLLHGVFQRWLSFRTKHALVHCFSFPKSKHLFDKWKHAIKRENFTPSPFNKVSS